MTKLDQLHAQVQKLSAEVSALKAQLQAHGADIAAMGSDLSGLIHILRVRKGRRKSARYVNISAADHLDRLHTWGFYEHLKRAEAVGRKFSRQRGEPSPWTKDWFILHVTDAQGKHFDSREFRRWFADTNTHAPGGEQDLRIRHAIQGQTAYLMAAGWRLSSPIRIVRFK